MRLFHLFSRKKPVSPAVAWKRQPPASPVYRNEEGRRYRADAPYLLPKDEQELQRLDYQHFILRQVLKGNTFAPVHQLLLRPCTLLDVGCGTGRWGIEMAMASPQAQVIGFDLEDIPHTLPPPSNYHFVQGNLLHGLPFASRHFDYVHQRLLVAAIPWDTWPWIVGELRRVTLPSGWVELVEAGTTFHQAGPATTQFLTWWTAISASKGIDASKMAQIGLLLKHGGFTQVQTKTEFLPVGSWGGRVGNLLAHNILAGWPSMKSSAHSLLHISPEHFDAIITQLADEWNVYRTSYEVYYACGQA